jgi:hypothetical protein
MKRGHLLLLILAFLMAGEVSAQDVVVFAYRGMPKSDAATLKRLYTGRIVSISQQSARPVNLVAGHPLRHVFLARLLGQDEREYTGYWLVRRYVGKGAPPAEFATVEEMVAFVGNTPGAVGYAPVNLLPPDSNIIFRP